MKLIAVRHGHSKANEQDLIVSNVENGQKERYGLTARGREQASGVIAALRSQGHVPSPDTSTSYAIYSSPFSRARETAEEIAKSLGNDVAVVLDDALRERYFGEALEGTSSDGYRAVWAQDEQDVSIGPEGGESVLEVAKRCEAFVDMIRQTDVADIVFLVSHGDTLSILAAHVGKRGQLERHREHGLENCGFLVL